MKIIPIHDIGIQMDREDCQELAQVLASHASLIREPI
jgi:hypothetical protein